MRVIKRICAYIKLKALIMLVKILCYQADSMYETSGYFNKWVFTLDLKIKRLKQGNEKNIQ